MTQLPILYSFRRCPYAIRARLALKISEVVVELREVKLSNKPQALLDCSPKATVPVLVLPNGRVIDQSLDIMNWALIQNDPENWLLDRTEQTQPTQQTHQWINANDNQFKPLLDRYKYADRYPEYPMSFYRQQAEEFIAKLDSQLQKQQFLLAKQPCLADIAIFPFVRQFAHVDKNWFDQTPYRHIQVWLNYFLNSQLFLAVMDKYQPWEESEESVVIMNQ